MSQPNERGLDRRSLLVRGGAVAAGAVGATLAGAVAAAPAYAAGLGYTPITPYRSFDSRSEPKIIRGEYFGLSLITDANGDATAVPVSAQALTFNLTITQTEGSGYLGVVPADTPLSGFVISNINWVTTGLDLANGGTTRLASDPDVGAGSVIVYCDGSPGAATYFLIDVTGYFA